MHFTSGIRLTKMDPNVLQRSLVREKARRVKAEKLLENKARQLYSSYDSLQKSHEVLGNALKEVKSQQHQLIQSEKLASLGVMSAGVAHEINNPLAFVFSNINSLNHAVVQFAQYHEYVNEVVASGSNTQREECLKSLATFSKETDLEYLIQDCAELIAETIKGIVRVKNIVSGLQSFARTDSGEMEPVDLHDCLNNTLKLVHNQIKYSAEVKLDFGELPEIIGYPGKLGQVFLNLIVNASHAIGKANGEISITTRYVADCVTIAIADTGCGMEQSTIDNIFTPFFTTKDVGMGTGLGLSISHGIVEEHQGTLKVDSEPGVGSTFTLTLPIAPAVEQAA